MSEGVGEGVGEGDVEVRGEACAACAGDEAGEEE